jgi:hypothetical protein
VHLSASLVRVVEELAEILAKTEAELRLEQAVHGLDARAEVALQALLADGLATRHHVTREAYYPSSSGKRSSRPRCDLVLTPRGQALACEERNDGCAPEDALWLEVKVAHQLRPSGRSNARYGQQWRRAIVSDLTKMRADPRIAHAAIALVVFNDTRATLEKDLQLFESLLGEAGLFGFQVARSVEITERIGHTLCSVAAWPLL